MTEGICTNCHGNGYVRDEDSEPKDCLICNSQGEVFDIHWQDTEFGKWLRA